MRELAVVCGSGAKYVIRGWWRYVDDSSEALSLGPWSVEENAQRFDDVFRQLAQRRSFRAYLQGLLLLRDRNKTLTALSGTELGVGAQAAAVQRLQPFVSESRREAAAVNQRRLELLQADPLTTTHEGGVLIISEEWHAEAHVGRQYLGSED